MSLTTAWNEQVYNYLFNQTSGPFLRLCTADPGNTGVLSNEVTGGGYRSLSIKSKFAHAYGTGAATSNLPLYFLDMPAVTVTHWAITANSVGTPVGDVIYTGPFAAPLVVAVGKTLAVNPGDITIAIT